MNGKGVVCARLLKLLLERIQYWQLLNFNTQLSFSYTKVLICSGLNEMPLESLHALQDELDSAIHDYSEVLLCQLVLREELGFQKELFNQFISLLLSIQKKRRMVDVDRKKGKALVDQPTYRVSCPSSLGV